MLINEIIEKMIKEISASSDLSEETLLEAFSFSSKIDTSSFVFEMARISKTYLEEAKRLKEIIDKKLPWLSVVLNGPVLFIDFKRYEFTKKFLVEIQESNFEFNLGKKKNVVVEYSSPNIAKIFHVGHLRSTILGNFIKNVYKKFNYNVTSINYLGDWGKQFGLVGVGYLKYGDPQKLENDPLHHLFDIYVKISEEAKNIKNVNEGVTDITNVNEGVTDITNVNEEAKNIKNVNEGVTDITNVNEGVTDITNVNEEAKNIKNVNEEAKNIKNVNEEAKNIKNVNEEAKEFFKKMEEGDEEKLKLWNRFKELSIKRYKEIYEILGVSFDIYSGESFYGEKGKKILLESKVVTEDEDGSKVINLDEKGNFIVLKNDGTSLYQTRDIAAAIERTEMFNPVEMIYVVAAEQDEYFVKLKLALVKLGYKDLITHVNYGLVLGMSSREGKAIFLEDVINETKEEMLKVMQKNKEKFEKLENREEIALNLAVSGLIIQDFGAKRRKDYTFNIKRCTSVEGTTGPYLQYTHCRLFSIQEMNSDIVISEDMSQENYYKDIILEQNDSIDNLTFLLSLYQIILTLCLKTYEPQTLVDYLMKVAKQTNSLIKKLRVKGVEKELALGRMFFFNCIRKILNDGMKVLGITPLNKM